MHAKLVLIVEGEEDRNALTSLFAYLSPILEKSLKEATLVIDPLHGASNLSYKISTLGSSLCNIHVFLDHDEAGRAAFEDSKGKSLIKLADCNFANCIGMPNSEMEDCFDIKLYENILKTDDGIHLNFTEFKNNQKWSDRMQKVYQAQGKIWNDKIKSETKLKIAKEVEKNPSNALNNHKKNAIISLIGSLEEKLRI